MSIYFSSLIIFLGLFSCPLNAINDPYCFAYCTWQMKSGETIGNHEVACEGKLKDFLDCSKQSVSEEGIAKSLKECQKIWGPECSVTCLPCSKI